MIKKLLNRENIIIGTVFVAAICMCILATYLVATNTEQDKCEEIRSEYQNRLDLAQDQYNSELADMRDQYETEIASVRSAIGAEMCSQYNIFFDEKYKSFDAEIEVMGTYPYVERMADDVLRETINESLNAAFLDWIPEEIQLYDCSDDSVMYNSDDLLSLSVGYQKLDDPSTWFEIYHTIDMRTGDILYLDDIVEVDEEFVDLLFTEGVINPANDPCPTYVSSFDKEYMLERLQECCEPYDGSNYYRKPTFYLKNHRLYFRYVFSDIDIFYVELDDIEDKLKIEKW
mgnify:CR=1 FL=1